MPEMEVVVNLPFPKAQAATVVLDPMVIGRAAPDVEKVERISGERYLWVVVVKLGFIKRMINLETVIAVHNEVMDFRGESPEIQITGKVSLLELDAKSCQLLFRAEYAGKGVLANVINNVVKNRSESASAEFQQRILECFRNSS